MSPDSDTARDPGAEAWRLSAQEDQAPGPASGGFDAASPEPIRLRTLLLLRWVAILGQLVALAVAVGMGLRFDSLAVLGVIGLSALMNLILSSPGRQPSSWNVALQLGLDVAQIAALLALTGGLSNPFALLILAPVTIAATALDRRKVILLSVVTVGLLSLSALLAAPLGDTSGHSLTMLPVLKVGHWVALVVAVGFFAAYAYRVSSELRARATALAAAEMALAREQKLQHLGGVVAAAAHEMGTPLATIKLVASELADDLPAQLDGREDLARDLALLRESADRCRDILRRMGRAGRDDLMLRAVPLRALLEEAAGPHAARGDIALELAALDDSAMPVCRRDPGLVHGLRNIIQNAVDFAADTVRIDAVWSAQRVTITVADDGPGYPPAMLARIGEPFLTRRRSSAERGAYEGMGLGLFIAKTLLERSGAGLAFRNGGPGAVVTISWPRARIESEIRGPLGENPEIVG